MRPSSWRDHVAPPSSVKRITPSCPAAQPRRADAKRTLTRSELTGAGVCRHVAPASSDSSTRPRTPTATSRVPARATAPSWVAVASDVMGAGVSSGSRNGVAGAAITAPPRAPTRTTAARRLANRRTVLREPRSTNAHGGHGVGREVVHRQRVDLAPAAAHRGGADEPAVLDEVVADLAVADGRLHVVGLPHRVVLRAVQLAGLVVGVVGDDGPVVLVEVA